MPNYKDITSEVNIRTHLCEGLGSRSLGLAHHFRSTMLYKGKTIGVWKSKGWDLLKGFEIRHTSHPDHSSDDSWFTVWAQTSPEPLDSIEALFLKRHLLYPDKPLNFEERCYLKAIIRKLDAYE
jgi:hypothetical protein